MARPVYSKLFIGVSAMDPNAGYTVPAGYTVVVRDLTVLFNGTPATNTACGLYDNNLELYRFLIEMQDPTPFYHHELMHTVFEEGVTFSIIGFGPTQIEATVSGYLLTNGT